MDRFHHDYWGADEGGPAAINAITQTPDGYLWIGGADGLWRFDGLTFEHLSGTDLEGTPPFAVSALFVTRKGELWIGFAQSGGVARYARGRIIDARLPRPPIQVTNIFEGPDGAVYAEWGGISERLWRWKDNRWQQVENTLGLPAGFTMGLVTTPDGTIWAPFLSADQTVTHIARMRPSETRFQVLDGSFDFARLAVSPQGALWLSDRAGLRRYIAQGSSYGPSGPLHALPDHTGMRFISFDRQGGIWSGSWGSPVISRITAATTETYRWSEAMDSDAVKTTFVDRQGAVWVGDSRGLHRFRPVDIASDPTVAPDNAGGIQLATGRDGTVYAASHSRLYRIRAGAAAEPVINLGDTPIFCAGRGSAMLLTQSSKLYTFDADNRLTFLAPTPMSPSACAFDAAGATWLRGGDGSTWRYGHGTFTELPRLKAPVRGGLLGLSVNANGEVGVPLDEDRVAVLSGGRWLIYDLGRIGAKDMAAMGPGLGGFMALTSAGLVRIAEGHAVRLDGRGAPWTRRLNAFVETPAGEVWFNGMDGLSRVRSSDLLAAFARRGGTLERRLFDTRDGVANGVQRLGPVGVQTAAGGDGRIWMVRRAGLATVDTRALTPGTTPPNILFRLLAADRLTIRDPQDATLPAGTRSIRIAFSATGVSRPDRVRLRYRLEGVDADWVDAGMRRGASYANLRPGKYAFVITAASEESGWKTRRLPFEILPTFFESWYFKVLCGAGLLALLWLAYRLRVTAISRRISARLAERHDERERIARELHDTLLQSVQALLLDFRLVADSIHSGNAGHARLDGVIRHAEAVIAEGRDRVHDLRSHREADGLERRLREIAEQAGLANGISLAVTSCGTAQPLVPAVAEEIARFATEALFNIARHSEATRVGILLNYLPTTVTITFADNGVGIDHAVLQAGRRPGHFGLVGMQERARKLKGEMLLDRGGDGGTEVTLAIPTRVAFAQSRQTANGWWRWLRRAFSR